MEEPWIGRSADSTARHGPAFWTTLAIAACAGIFAIIYAANTYSPRDPTFSAANLANNYSPASFEAVRLNSGELYFSRITSANGLIVLKDVYFQDPSTSQLVYGLPGSDLAWSGAANQAGANQAGANQAGGNQAGANQAGANQAAKSRGSGSYGAGTPMVVNPSAIVSVEPVDPESPIGREISANQTRLARSAKPVPITVPRGFQ
ncbi:MAG TPA: hypothetical protein VMU77_00515 [Acidimicrobiales bacterium]|nr:hypothetical protein [Acidimicrobiales bacterium]